MIKIDDLKSYALDFVNDNESMVYYSGGRVPTADVICIRVNRFNSVEKARFAKVLAKARERVIVYVERDEGEYEHLFNESGYFWDHLGDFVYVVDKHE